MGRRGGQGLGPQHRLLTRDWNSCLELAGGSGVTYTYMFLELF